jgi:phage-related baseplate assembly protein
MAAAVQASAAQLLDLTVGSTLRAVLEANASVCLWMQWLILQVLRTTRAATSTGADLDSWMADLSLTRLPAASATGIVTFSRITPTLAALVPAGALVRTADGTQTFSVLADTTHPAWAGASNGYVIASGLASLDLPVTALVPGNTGNVQADAISLLASAVPGIDSVSNASAFLNGLDAESDDAFRRRFRNFIASRSRATPAAIAYAITSIQQGLNYTIQENTGPTGKPSLGQFVVTVDDGSGSPSTAMLSTVQAAIEAVRPIGSLFSVHPPSIVTAGCFDADHRGTGYYEGTDPGDCGQCGQGLHQWPADWLRAGTDEIGADRVLCKSIGDQCERFTDKWRIGRPSRQTDERYQDTNGGGELT